MMPAAKHFDPVLGIDIHIVQPPGPVPPVPAPHPFIGIVIDPFDYVPIIGATVMVNGLPRAQAGTEGKCIPSHIPIGGVFVKPPANECELFMGSATVEVDGDAFSHLAHPALSCQDIGMVPPFRMKKKSKTHSLVLPTSVVLPIPAGAPVLVGGPPTISLMAMGMKAGMAGLSRLGKGIRKAQKGAGRFGRAMKNISDALHSKAKKIMDDLGVPPNVQNKVHHAICSVTGHPVDIASGKVFTKLTDFELPGPIPFTWERIWFSTSIYTGPAGYGWHHKYDLGLIVDDQAKAVALRMEDGRPVAFPTLVEGQEHFDRTEKLTLFRDNSGYAIRNPDNLIYRFHGQRNDEAAERKLTSIEDMAGNSIQFRYDHNKRLHKVIDSGGRTLQFEHDQQGRITSLFAPHPEKPGQWFTAFRYIYDDQGNLVGVVDSIDQKTQYRYEGHLLVQETDRNGLSFYFTYDGNDHTAKCIRTWGDKGIYDHKLAYLEAEALTIVENSLGHKTQHYRNTHGLVTEVIDARGGVTKTEYNEFNEKISETDPLGHVTSYSYDEFGNQITINGADGAVLNVKYDRLRNPLAATDTIGGKWRWEYDQAGRLIKRVNPLGETTAYQYSGKWLSGITDPLGGHTSLGFDYHGNLTYIRTADAAESHWQYDLLGRATAAIDPKGNQQTQQFDLLGRVVEVQEPDGNVRQLQYDPEGNVVHAKDKQHDVKFAYSGMGRMVARGEAGTTVQFAYNTEEQLIGIRNEHGFVYRFQLDENGDVAVESGFDGVRRVYERDAAGRVVNVKRASGLVTAYHYDPAGRVTTVEHSDGSAESYHYRLDGELVEATNNTTTIRFERDALGRILKEWQGEDFWVASEYNPLGLRTRMSSSLGAIQTIERNIMGDVTRLAYASQPNNHQENTHTDWEAHFKRDIMGLELERQLPGGIRSRWERDKLGRPIQHRLLDGDTALRDVRYVWDVSNRLRQVIDAHKGITKYHHDALGNLAAAQYGDGTIELRMPDAVGNLFRTKDRSDRKYGPAGQLLESHSPEGTTFYQYDAEGNLISKQEPGGKQWEYHWNAAGMLDHVVRPDQEIVRFTYDALARRTSKEFKGNITRWVWDGNNPLHEWVEILPDSTNNNQAIKPSHDQAKVVQQEFYVGHPPTAPPSIDVPHSKTETLFGDLTGTPKGLITWLFEPESFVPVAKIVDDKKYSIVTDYLGTPVAMLDQGGGKVWSADLSIYGEMRNLQGKREDCLFRWPGQYEDIETELYYNRFRFYSLEEGEYLSQDPARDVSGIRLYHYIYFHSFGRVSLFSLQGGASSLSRYPGDPSGWIDPFGLVRIHDENGVAVNAYPGPEAGGIEHRPLHVHVNEAGKKETRVLMEDYYKKGELVAVRGDVYPGDPPLSKKAKKIINNNLDDIANKTDSVFRTGRC